MLTAVVPTHSSPFWHSKLHPVMLSSYHLLSSCTNTRLGPLFLREFVTLTQQPSRFMNELMPTLIPPNHRQTKDANLLHPCMLSSQLQCTTPFTRSGYLPLWYVSCQKTATKCTPVMMWSTATLDGTSCECSVKPTDTTSDVTIATLQAPTRPHISVLPPAPTKPAQLLQALPVAPTTPVTPKPQTPAVPEVTPVPVPMSATPSIAPVQPHRLGHAHITHKCLIKEL